MADDALRVPKTNAAARLASIHARVGPIDEAELAIALDEVPTFGASLTIDATVMLATFQPTQEGAASRQPESASTRTA